MHKKQNSNSSNALRFALVTRHLNRSGYACLKHLVGSGYIPQTLIVSSKTSPLSSTWLRPFIIAFYKLKLWFYRAEPLRMINSEELYARQNGIKVMHFDTLKTHGAKKIISSLNLDLLIFAGGWHEKIPDYVLQTPLHGSINVHPSMLPEFRGTSITRWQIMERVNKSGVTIHRMNDRFDSGELLAQVQLDVSSKATPQSLFEDLSNEAGPLLVGVLKQFPTVKFLSQKYRKPNPRYLRYYSKWKWNSTVLTIDIDKDFKTIHAHVLASSQESYEYPGPQLRLNGASFMIRKASISSRTRSTQSLQKGAIIAVIDKRYLRLERCGEPVALLIEQIQPSDSFYWLRRSNTPSHWFKQNQEVTITAHENIAII